MCKFWKVLGCLCLLVVTPVKAAPSIDPAELEAFMDGVVHATMRQNNIVGATVAITQDDQVIVLKGYGYACLLYTSDAADE